MEDVRSKTIAAMESEHSEKTRGEITYVHNMKLLDLSGFISQLLQRL